MFAELMTSRRFAPLFWCQFFSAFNDNFVRNMLAMLILFRIGEASAAPLVTLAIGLFILPSILISGLGGEIADAHDKALIARRLKFAEIFVQMIAAAGFWFASLPLLFAALFGLGVVAALFGPIKYGILPDHLKTQELPAGNALVEAATFLAILLGIVVGGFAAEEGRAPITVVAQLMAVALACWGAARFIPATVAAAPGLKVDPNIFASTGRLLSHLRADRRLWVGAIGLSIFWMTGAVALPLVAVLVKTRIGGGIAVETAVNALFAIGIAVGSVAAAVIAHGRILLVLTPFAALGMAAFLIDLGLATQGLKASGEMSLSAFFASAAGVRVAIDVAGLAAMGGLFVVPLFSAVQAWAGEDRRARVIAGVNVLNAMFMVAGAGIAALAQSSAIGLGEPVLLVALGAVNIAGAIYLFRKLPANFAGDALNLYFRLFHRVEVRGMEHLKQAGERAVIALNHVSFLDAPLILSLLEDKPVFAIDSGIAKRWWVKPFLGIARVFPMDPTKPLGTRGLIQEVKAGHRLVIFPEGRITITGALMKVYDGAAMIADKSEATIVPVRIDGLERSFFSRLTDGQVRRSLFPKTRVTFLPPRKLTIDAELRGRKRRHAAGAALYDVMSDLYFATSRLDGTLIEAFADSVRSHGAKRDLLEDPVTGKLTARTALIGAAVLGRKIAAISAPGEALGLMLPNANGAAVTYFALQAAGRVPAMINYTAGAANILGACRTACVKTVLTSRAFVEKANLGAIVTAMAEAQTIVYLEDLRKQITLVDKLRGLIEAGRPLHRRDPGDPAAILFTSGSEGAPKAVVLSHRNLLANVQQIVARYDITARDSVFNVLPVFHSFGMTGGMLLPLLTGMRLYLYPSPLHYRQIPELVYGSNSTVLFGTDTFLAGYARTANPYDFRSLRYVVAGAEPVKAETRRVYHDKFGLRIMEGYGVTETSPVLAVNDPMFNRVGTVGRLMPGVEYRLEAVPGIDVGGRLHVRGPNVMLGYYRPENPGLLEPPPEGWHDTGDIVTVDEQKFVTIKGRAKRFAKIAGEMVSLAQVEHLLADYAPEHLIAMVSVPDPRKGERLVMVTTRADAQRAAVQAHLKSKGATELMAPSEVMIVDAVPLLGSGKTDYVQLDKMVREKLARAAA
ncbi:MAG: acyl-[ACP]--phospholipid O-acyltransferase [Methylobacteriaceae bacterium]|nr:acyl-[ACP]--phospholipid O-acyltransferase [Methylobacteriaceae bacterium]